MMLVFILLGGTFLTALLMSFVPFEGSVESGLSRNLLVGLTCGVFFSITYLVLSAMKVI